MTTAETYERLRPLMFSIAYRMLGRASEAEDVVQEAFLRYHLRSPGRAVRPTQRGSTRRRPTFPR